MRIYDHRGHGRSGGPRGDVPHQDTLLQDAEIVIGDFAHQLGAPPLLFGHSMGGLFAARLALAAKNASGRPDTVVTGARATAVAWATAATQKYCRPLRPAWLCRMA
ncbi:alpha/beta hydrolase [Undibacterium arcticum]